MERSPGVPTVEDTLIPTDKNNFAPRVGFAYRLNDSGSLVARGGYGIYYDRFSTRYANTQLLNYPYLALAVGLPGILRTMSDPFIPVPQPGQFPVNPTIPSPLSPLAPIVGVPISGIFIDPELRTPYIQQYNANVQWEFANDFLLEAGYVGSKGTKLLQVITLNQPVYNRAANVFTAPFGTALSTQKNVAGGIQQVQSTSNSNYNSLQLSVTKRFSRGLQFLSAYTYGKSKDYYSGGTINELFAVAGDQFDWRTNYGPSDFDRRHRFVTSFVYDLPKLVSESSSARVLLNNWQLNGILTLQTGTPFSIVDIVGNNIIQRANFASGFSGSVETSGSTQERLNAIFQHGRVCAVETDYRGDKSWRAKQSDVRSQQSVWQHAAQFPLRSGTEEHGLLGGEVHSDPASRSGASSARSFSIFSTGPTSRIRTATSPCRRRLVASRRRAPDRA